MDRFQPFARNTPIMPRPQAQPLCDCLARTTQALHRFPNFSTGSSDTYYIPLDEVLTVGDSLIDHWKLLHGCRVTDTHLDKRMLQTMIDAAIKMLTLYDAAVASIIGGWRETQEPNSGGIDPSNNPASTRDGNRDDPVETKPKVIVTKVTVNVGVLQLDIQEVAAVAGEILRQATTRLGEMLHDIEDMSILRNGVNHSQGSVKLREVRDLRSWMLRILGRINSNNMNMNEL
ncbi:hypothetical protein N7453_007615 [Penicillium expansum]|nr:hypothetical protein N7453_007615 [Penicillium expansum]